MITNHRRGGKTITQIQERISWLYTEIELAKRFNTPYKKLEIELNKLHKMLDERGKHNDRH